MSITRNSSTRILIQETSNFFVNSNINSKAFTIAIIYGLNMDDENFFHTFFHRQQEDTQCMSLQ